MLFIITDLQQLVSFESPHTLAIICQFKRAFSSIFSNISNYTNWFSLLLLYYLWIGSLLPLWSDTWAACNVTWAGCNVTWAGCNVRNVSSDSYTTGLVARVHYYTVSSLHLPGFLTWAGLVRLYKVTDSRDCVNLNQITPVVNSSHS